MLKTDRENQICIKYTMKQACFLCPLKKGVDEKGKIICPNTHHYNNKTGEWDNDREE